MGCVALNFNILMGVEALACSPDCSVSQLSACPDLGVAWSFYLKTWFATCLKHLKALNICCFFDLTNPNLIYWIWNLLNYPFSLEVAKFRNWCFILKCLDSFVRWKLLRLFLDLSPSCVFEWRGQLNMVYFVTQPLSLFLHELYPHWFSAFLALLNSHLLLCLAAIQSRNQHLSNRYLGKVVPEFWLT